MTEIFDSNTWLIIFIISFIILVLLIYALCVYFIVPFFNDRRHIKKEMLCASSEREYRYWKRELRRLYIYYLPFGKYFLRFF